MVANSEPKFGSLSIDGVSVVDTIAIFLLPTMLVAGWLIAVFGEFQLSILPLIFLILICIFISIFFVLRKLQWSFNDLRWFWVPIIISFTSWLELSWTGPMLWDQADHLQTANRYLGHWLWEPFHQERDYSFRPKLISGLVALEFSLTGHRTHAFVIPYLLLLGCGWQIQRFVEEQRGISWSLLAVVLVLTMPTMMIRGRTVFLEAMIVGSLVLILRDVLLTNISKFNEKDAIRWGIIASLVGAAKYPYLYLGPGCAILIYGLTRNLRLTFLCIGAWALIQAPFVLADLIDHGNALASLGPQVNGTINSVTDNSGDYTPLLALEDLQGELLTILQILLGCGVVIWITQNIKFHTGIFVLLILPGIILFIFILDFGWPRYHLPWLTALTVLGISGLSHPIPKVSKEREKKIIAGSIVLLISLSSIQIYTNLSGTFEEREKTEDRVEKFWEFVEQYTAFKSDIPSDAVVLAGFDISLGLRYEVPTFRFGPSEDPIHDSIIVVNATHVVTGGIATRFSWEENPIEILGSPLTLVNHSTLGNDHHILWKVDSNRMITHDLADSLPILDSREHVGDTYLMDGGFNFTAPQGWEITKLVDLGTNGSDGSSEIDRILGLPTPASVICLSMCPETIQVPEGTTYIVQVGWLNA